MQRKTLAYDSTFRNVTSENCESKNMIMDTKKTSYVTEAVEINIWSQAINADWQGIKLFWWFDGMH